MKRKHTLSFMGTLSIICALAMFLLLADILVGVRMGYSQSPLIGADVNAVTTLLVTFLFVGSATAVGIYWNVAQEESKPDFKPKVPSHEKGNSYDSYGLGNGRSSGRYDPDRI